MRRLLVAAALLAAGCGRGEPGRAPAAATHREAPRTDDAAHELAVLDAEIEDWRARAAVSPSSTDALVERLLRRASVRGRLDDYLAADAASRRWIEAAPQVARAHLTRALVDARLHRFDAARAELAAARAAGALPGDLEAMTRVIDQATGRAAAVVPALERAVDRHPSATNLSTLALALADAGRLDDALALMPRALASYRGTSPFAVAGLLFQWGRLHEERGELAAARERYRRARAVMPQHVEATIHLAGILAVTGERPAAIALYEALVAETDLPEPRGELARLLVGRDSSRAAALRDAADAGWRRHVDALPEAFADHHAAFRARAGLTR